MIELDVFGCASGEVVVFHDLKLERLTGQKGRINQKTLSEIKQLKIGSDQTIPTLDEVLDAIGRKAKVNIELKGNKSLVSTLSVIEKYVRQKRWEYTDFLLSSFSRKALKKAQRLKPQVPRAPLASYSTVRLLSFAEKIKAYAVHVKKNLIDPKFINDAHAKGFKVFVWTVNELSEIKALKSLGVDGIFSDYIDRI